MDQAGSGLGSTVIQIYWQAVLQGYFSNNNAIRCHSAQVLFFGQRFSRIRKCERNFLSKRRKKGYKCAGECLSIIKQIPANFFFVFGSLKDAFIQFCIQGIINEAFEWCERLCVLQNSVETLLRFWNNHSVFFLHFFPNYRSPTLPTRKVWSLLVRPLQLSLL